MMMYEPMGLINETLKDVDEGRLIISLGLCLHFLSAYASNF